MKENLYFKSIPDIGQLFMEQILFSYEGIPIVFVCLDVVNNRYLCVCDDIIDEESWLIVKINNKKLLEILNDDSTVLSAFVDKNIIIANKGFNQDIKYNAIDYNSISKDELPICDQFLEMKDHLYNYIKKIENTTLSENFELDFSFYDGFDEELIVFKSNPTFINEIRNEIYNNSDTKNSMSFLSNNSFSIEIDCNVIHEKLNKVSDYTEKNISFAA